MKFFFKISLFILVLIGLSFQKASLSYAQQAANTATFSLSPSSGTFSGTFSIDVKVTTGPNTKVTTLRADIIYLADKLTVTNADIDTTGSFIDQNAGQWLTKDATSLGTITLSGSLSNAASTENKAVQFAKITFHVKTTGSATLSFGNSSAIYLYQPGATTPTNIYAPSSPSGGTYTLTSADSSGGTTTTPTPTTATGSGNLPNAGTETPTMILIFVGVIFTIVGAKKLLFSSL